MSSCNILLIPGEQSWTSRALHLACAMARGNNGTVILLKMVPAGHPALLGSPEGQRHLTDAELEVLADLMTAAEKYNVPVEVTLCQYANYGNALISAAEQLEATAVFATLPPSRIPFWSRFQQWRLENVLARQDCTLQTVPQSGGPLEWTPSANQPTSARHRTESKA